MRGCIYLAGIVPGGGKAGILVCGVRAVPGCEALRQGLLMDSPDKPDADSSPPGRFATGGAAAGGGGGRRSPFRKFFIRGLGILLPTVLTIWILLTIYQFLQNRIAEPINRGVRELVLQTTPWPWYTEQARQTFMEQAPQADQWSVTPGEAAPPPLKLAVRRYRLQQWWGSYYMVLDLIGLVIAVVLIYAVGLVLGSFIGRRLHQRGEELIHRLPLVKRVYPSVKQVTDFFVGEKNQQLQFNRVVAVEYPRRGLWSVGLVTGDTMRAIQQTAEVTCLTVFIPSSPTPFTGYVITVPKSETIDLPITIEEAMKFTVSGGVLIPDQQKIQPIGDQPGIEFTPVGEPADAGRSDSSEAGRQT